MRVDSGGSSGPGVATCLHPSHGMKVPTPTIGAVSRTGDNESNVPRRRQAAVALGVIAVFCPRVSALNPFLASALSRSDPRPLPKNDPWGVQNLIGSEE